MVNRADVIIGGASYAGLAASLALGRRAIMIDQHDIGAVQRSACAMPVAVVKRFGADDSIIQQYDNLYFHDTRGVHCFPLTSPYCIINHRMFCQMLWERSEASFVKARIRSFSDSTVSTTSGDYTAAQFVDATGWPGVLIAGGRRAADKSMRLTVAIEADVPGEGEGLHFYYAPELISKGYGWVFPAGDELRIGVGSYDRSLDVKQSLARFLDQLGFNGKPARGGMIPWFDAEPVVGNVLAAGDAAGHCLPLTAEGIRLALGFGAAAGRILSQVVDGEIRPDEAIEEYRSISRLHQRSFTAMRLSQLLIGRFPDLGVHLVARGLATERVMPAFLHAYLTLGAELGRAA